MKILFWTVIVFLVVRWLMKPYIRFAVNSTLDKMAEDEERSSKRREGHITVKTNTSNTKHSNRDGEYIDFEEIK